MQDAVPARVCPRQGRAVLQAVVGGNGGRAGTPVMISNANGGWTLENGDHGRLMYNLERKFTEQRYLHPIPAAAIVLNPNLEQNAAWK